MTTLLLHDFSYRAEAHHAFLNHQERIHNSGRFFDGEFTEELEASIAGMKKMRYAVATNSGSSALYTLARYAKLVHGIDTVRLTNYTFEGVYATLAHLGVELDAVPSDLNGLALHTDHEHKHVLEIVTGLLGQNTHYVPECPYLMHDAAQNWINADLGQGLGAALSFDPTKNLGSHGNGGMILTNSRNVARAVAHLCRRRQDPDFNTQPGYEPLNMRISEMEAADLLTQLPYLRTWQQERAALAQQFDALFGPSALTRDYASDDVQKYAIRTRNANQAWAIATELKIETKVLYPHRVKNPLLQLPLYPGMDAGRVLERYQSLRLELEKADLLPSH